LSPNERHPLLSSGGRQVLEAMLEEPQAPLWSHQRGDRLDRVALE
jgi:phenylacetate-CoA ligase